MCSYSNFIKAICAALFLSFVSTDVLAQSNNVVPIVPSATVLNREFGSHDRELFLSPDKVFYPETWFHFIGGNVSYEGITADLEAIAAAGISGVHFFHGQQGSKWPATGEDIECMSEKWENAVRFVAEECKRLNLRFTIQNCPGWAMSGGPWIKPENAMRLLVSSATIVNGAEKVLPLWLIPSQVVRSGAIIVILLYSLSRLLRAKRMLVHSLQKSLDVARMIGRNLL